MTDHPHRPHQPDSSRPEKAETQLPVVYAFDCAASRALDRAATEEFGVPGIVLMENASRNAAQVALGILARLNKPQPQVLIACGKGNNGGDGYAIARHLHNAGVPIRIVSIGDPKPESDAGTNAAICRKMGIETSNPQETIAMPPDIWPDLIVDALFGTGLTSAIEGDAAALVDWINDVPALVLAIDVPSGLDADSGQALGPVVRASQTITFVGVKQGFLELNAQPFLGQIVVGDIGAPAELIRRFGRAVTIRSYDDRSQSPADPNPGSNPPAGD